MPSSRLPVLRPLRRGHPLGLPFQRRELGACDVECPRALPGGDAVGLVLGPAGQLHLGAPVPPAPGAVAQAGVEVFQVPDLAHLLADPLVQVGSSGECGDGHQKRSPLPASMNASAKSRSSCAGTKTSPSCAAPSRSRRDAVSRPSLAACHARRSRAARRLGGSVGPVSSPLSLVSQMTPSTSRATPSTEGAAASRAVG